MKLLLRTRKLTLCFLLLSLVTFAKAASTGVLHARWHESGFEGDDNYNAVTAASDGKIYYVICAHGIEKGAQMFSYDPATDKVVAIADLTEASGEKGQKSIPQGKSHVPFFEHKGKLYFATHMGYYQVIDGKEMVGVPPAGYKPYPGGHFLAYDMKTGKIEKLATAPGGEGIITFAMDYRKERLYGLTWPSGRFLRYDLDTRKMHDLGLTAGQGEKGVGDQFRVVSRAIAVNPVLGGVMFSDAAGNIWRYDWQRQDKDLEIIEGSTLKMQILGNWDPNKPGSMGYNWRQIVWYPRERLFYGIHGNTGQLFRFDSDGGFVEAVDRLASQQTVSSGLFDKFPYGYLGLTLGPDGDTLYYLTGTPLDHEIHFVTYHIPTKKRIDHGALVLPDGTRPTWAQAIAVGPDKRIYTVSKVNKGGKLKVDLLSFPDPLQNEPAPEPEYELIRSWLNPTGMPNPLEEAHSICFDKDGNVIVVDSIASRVHRFTPEGKWLSEIGFGPGSNPGQFSGPRDARVNSKGDIFVSDANNYRIQVFNHEGEFLRMFGQKGRGEGQFLRGHGLEFSPDQKRLYIVDVDNNRVAVFDPSGKFLYNFGRKGSAPGEFREAHGIGVMPDGDVIVSNYYGPTQRFTPEGKFLYDFGAGGFRGWVYFHSMTTDNRGYTYIAARDQQRRNAIVIYDDRGEYAGHFIAKTGEGEQGVKTAAVDRDGNIYVAVEGRGVHGVQVFRRKR
jgi:DNA-binding beta-propeller fold protein YncE